MSKVRYIPTMLMQPNISVTVTHSFHITYRFQSLITFVTLQYKSFKRVYDVLMEAKWVTSAIYFVVFPIRFMYFHFRPGRSGF